MKRRVALILGLVFLVAGSSLAGAADIRGTYEGTATAILPTPGDPPQDFDLNAIICEVFDGLFRASFQVVGDEPVLATGFISVDKRITAIIPLVDPDGDADGVIVGHIIIEGKWHGGAIDGVARDTTDGRTISFRLVRTGPCEGVAPVPPGPAVSMSSPPAIVKAKRR